MKLEIKELSIVVFIIAVIFLINPIKDLWFRTFPKCDHFGKDLNPERKTLGILEIPENWNTQDFSSCSKTWLPPTNEGIRKRKIVVAEQGEIDSEMDIIVFGDSVITLVYSYRVSSFIESEVSVGSKTIMIPPDTALLIVDRWVRPTSVSEE